MHNTHRSPFRSFRLVCGPPHCALVEELLRAQGFVFEPEPFLASARRLVEEPFPLGASLAALFGYIYIQDRSSMLPPLALDPPEGGTVLDMCASPGSKTGLSAQLVGNCGFVLGNEPHPGRLAVLRRNLTHLNLLQTATCSFPGENIPLPDASQSFIQLDPPCSGWGTADKHPRTRVLWRGEKLRPLLRLQRLLLKEAARLLAPGGRLVYSTCTTNPEENEAQIRFAVEELKLTLRPLSPFAGFCFDSPAPGAEGSLLVNGQASGAQGFFIALLTKDASFSSVSAAARRPSASRGVPLRPLPPEVACGALRENLPPGELLLAGDTVFFMPKTGAVHLPEHFRAEGCAVGVCRSGRLRLASRLRCLLPPAPEAGSLNLEEIGQVGALLAGRSLDTGFSGKECALYLRGLPLARLRLKGGRAVL